MEVCIIVTPSCFLPQFKMIIEVPSNVDIEEYIDGLLDTILEENLKYNIEWDIM